MDKLIKTLKLLGYSEKEAAAYLTLLRMGRGTAYSIAEKSGLKKPTAHVILGELLKKGAVFTMPMSKKKIYIARSPEDLFDRTDAELAEAKKNIPLLLSLGQENRSNFKTLYFEGLKGLKDALDFDSKYPKKEIVGFYALADKVDPLVLKIFNAWRKRNEDNHVRMRGITPDHFSTRLLEPLYKPGLHKFYFVPFKTYSSKVSLESMGDYIRIIDIQRLQAVVIQNPDIAESFKQIFEMVWEHQQQIDRPTPLS